MTAINSLSFPFLSLFLSSLSPDSLSFPFLSLRQRERKEDQEKKRIRKGRGKKKKGNRVYCCHLSSLLSFFFFFPLSFFFSFFSLLSSTDCQCVVPCRFSAFWKLSRKVCSIQSLYFIMLFFWSIPLNVSFSCTSIHSDLGWILAVFFENNLCRVSLTALFLGLNGL